MNVSDFKEDIILKIPESKSVFESNQDNISTLAELMKLPNAIKVFSELGFFQFKKDRINNHDCLICALKHLRAAMIIMAEMLNGYQNDEYEDYLIGNLNEAQEQITVIDINISNSIRDLRIEIENSNKLTVVNLKTCKELIASVKDLRGTKFTVEIQANKIKTAPCACGKN